MKKLFLFVLAAALVAGCSESSIGDDSELAGPNPSITDGVLNIHVAEKGTLEAILAAKEIDVWWIVSLKITGELNDMDFKTIQHMKYLRNLDLTDVNLSILPAEAFIYMNVEHLVLPNTLTEIRNMAFWSCRNLTSIDIPASVKTIEQAAFQGCSELATVTFETGSKLKTIGGGYSSYPYYSYYGAFLDCTALTSIEIPASVETIEEDAFCCCSKLGSMTFEKGSQLKTIGDSAFHNLSSLQTVDMSACTQVETIGYDAFYHAYNLRLFKIGTATPPECNSNAFGKISIWTNPVLKVPSGCVDAYKAAVGWCEFASITELDE